MPQYKPQAGRLITFEGGEGVGKSTQVKALGARLNAQGLEVIITREPGGCPGAEAIRELLVTGDVGRWAPASEALLHFAARYEHVENVIKPALAKGQWVICDRFTDSTMAYQGYGMGLGRDKILALQQLVLESFSPDMTIILDMPVSKGLARAAGRNNVSGAVREDRYEKMNMAFHARLRDAFLDIAHREPKRCLVVNAEDNIDEISAIIWSAVDERLGL